MESSLRVKSLAIDGLPKGFFCISAAARLSSEKLRLCLLRCNRGCLLPGRGDSEGNFAPASCGDAAISHKNVKALSFSRFEIAGVLSHVKLS